MDRFVPFTNACVTQGSAVHARFMNGRKGLGMAEPIERAGEWWHRGDDGTWQRWDKGAEVWVASAVGPPPPPPPPGAAPSLPVSPELQFTSFLSEGASASVPPRANRTFLSGPVQNKSRFELPAMGRASSVLVGVVFLVAALAGYLGITALLDGDPPAAATPVSVIANAGAGGTEKNKSKGSSKARFIAEADAVCTTMMEQQRMIAPPTTLEGVMSAAAEVQGILRTALGRLTALDPPGKDRRVWRKQLRGLEASIAEVDVLIAAALRGDAAGIQASEARVQTINDRFNRWATRYGFTVCNQEA